MNNFYYADNQGVLTTATIISRGKIELQNGFVMDFYENESHLLTDNLDKAHSFARKALIALIKESSTLFNLENQKEVINLDKKYAELTKAK